MYVNIITREIINIKSVNQIVMSVTKESCKKDIYNARYDFYGKIVHIHNNRALKNAYQFLYVIKLNDSLLS